MHCFFHPFEKARRVVNRRNIWLPKEIPLHAGKSPNT